MFGNTNLANLDNVKNSPTSESNMKRLYQWLNDLHSSINKDRINSRELDILMEQLTHIAEHSREEYLKTLLYPETVIGKKIPTLFPIHDYLHFYHLDNDN